MIEKVNPSHPDKVADRIAGAMVDLAYTKNKNARMAAEVLLGHGGGLIIAETNCDITLKEVQEITNRITDGQIDMDKLRYHCVPQDPRLAENQQGKEMRCGDNGIFRGVPLTEEERVLSRFARELYKTYPTDGKFILDNGHMTVCQSRAEENKLGGKCLQLMIGMDAEPLTLKVNPLGYWTGGLDVDSGATNRKLGSDMAGAVTGGGLHGKDLSKADVSINIWCHMAAQAQQEEVHMSCSIGDLQIRGLYYSTIVEQARRFIEDLGGFEKFAEWGLF